MSSMPDLFPSGTPVRLKLIEEVPILLRGRFVVYDCAVPQFIADHVYLESWVDRAVYLEVGSDWLESEPLPPDAVARFHYMLNRIPFDARLEEAYTPYRSVWQDMTLRLARLGGESHLEFGVFWRAPSVAALLQDCELRDVDPKDRAFLEERWQTFCELHKKITDLEAEVLD